MIEVCALCGSAVTRVQLRLRVCLRVLAVQVPSDMVRVLVSHVSLVDGPVLYDDSIKMLFVDYSFLDIPIKETETPCSLPKPTMPDKNITFNFSKSKSTQFKFLFLLQWECESSFAG